MLVDGRNTKKSAENQQDASLVLINDEVKDNLLIKRHLNDDLQTYISEFSSRSCAVLHSFRRSFHKRRFQTLLKVSLIQTALIMNQIQVLPVILEPRTASGNRES